MQFSQNHLRQLFSKQLLPRKSARGPATSRPSIAHTSGVINAQRDARLVVRIKH